MKAPDLLTQIRLAGLPEPTPEYRFAPPRRWRFDLCWLPQKIALEREGGTWTGGRHIRPRGYRNDCEKYNEAALLGWVLIRVTVDMIRDGKAIEFITRAFSESYLKEDS